MSTSLKNKMKIRETGQKISYHGLAISILQKARRPLTIPEIAEKILKIKKVKGKTPNNTINNVLQYSKHAKRVGYGLYQYRP